MTVGRDIPANSDTLYAADAYQSLGVDNSLDMRSFEDNVTINVLERSKKHIVFEVIGIDAPVANALRRIMIGQVPTVAIETVTFFNNTSIMSDEMLAHRLGLVPLDISPESDEEYKFTLKVSCTRVPGSDADAPPEKKYENSTVYSGSLQCESHPHIRPIYDDIILTKLRQGQSIDLECMTKKSIGADHAKFSPVAPATYRLLPEITIIDKNGVTGDDAEEARRKCPMNVFDIEDGFLVAARPRNCTLCRECIRGDDWNKRIKVALVKNHYIFSVESESAYAAEDIVKAAFRILGDKADELAGHVQNL
jgi:DNA-directed RNA polymerase I and III subunit RPAC1